MRSFLQGKGSNPGGGCLYKSIDAGLCFRETEIPSIQPSSALASGGGGFRSLTPPVLGVPVR